MPTMNVSLTPQMIAFVNALTDTGDYASASEVVRDGLRLLEREKAVEAEKREILKRAVEAGLTDARAHRFSSRTAADIARDVVRTSGRAS
jgi:antitoxin ParD1/3/4